MAYASSLVLRESSRSQLEDRDDGWKRIVNSRPGKSRRSPSITTTVPSPKYLAATVHIFARFYWRQQAAVQRIRSDHGRELRLA
jgi:hypothetical protein